MPTQRRNGNRRRNPRRRRVPQASNSFFEKEERVQTYSPSDLQIVHMAKIVEKTNIVTSTTSAVFRSFAFSASECSDIAEMASVFDQYRLDRVDIRIVPNVTELLTSTPNLGRNYSVIDFDDANAFTSMTDPLDYNNCLAWEITDPICITLRPRLAVAAYAGTFTGFANSRPMWIDAASSGVEHYGVKLAFGAMTTSITYTVTCKYYLVWRMSH
jgi:hypothetical protein